MPLKVTVEKKPGGYVVIHPDGHIDATTYKTLAEEVERVLKGSPSLLIFNLEKVNYVSSAGIGVVLAAEKALKQTNGKALLVNLKPQIKKVFDIVKALPSQQVFASVKELDEYLAEIQRKVREGE